MKNLPKIRVTEPSGLRRFLYPLTALVLIRENVDEISIALEKSDGTQVPVQIQHVGAGAHRCDFAVSLAPYETVDLSLVEGTPDIVPDRLHVTYEDGDLTNIQQRLRLEIGQRDLLRSVVYDAVEHLRSPLRIERNTESLSYSLHSKTADFLATIAASVGVHGSYADGIIGETKCAITACKSWVTVNHCIWNVPQGETVTFTLPFAVTGEKLVADFGTGNGTYAHIPAEADKAIIWRAEQSEAGWSWQLHVNDRLDYSSTLLPHELALRNWLHVIDADKSIAVAVLSPLEGLVSLETRITGDGDIVTSFHTDDSVREKREFAICYHFLNALPPIAAATNPHSILEPPIVEVISG